LIKFSTSLFCPNEKVESKASNMVTNDFVIERVCQKLQPTPTACYCAVTQCTHSQELKPIRIYYDEDKTKDQ
jgi:hypothetical protein